jgi:hypothetical protein
MPAHRFVLSGGFVVSAREFLVGHSVVMVVTDAALPGHIEPLLKPAGHDHDPFPRLLD